MTDAIAATDLLTRLDASADAVLERQIRLLRDLVACQTVSTTVPTESFTREASRAVDLVEHELIALGFASERWRSGAGFPSLAATRSIAGQSPVIGFNGHLDVVPIESRDSWRQDPWGGGLVGSRLFGRGACDAKGPLVSEPSLHRRPSTAPKSGTAHRWRRSRRGDNRHARARRRQAARPAPPAR